MQHVWKRYEMYTKCQSGINKKSNTNLVIYFFIADGQQAATHFDHSCGHLQDLFLQGKM